jgi:hypothetical protein
MFTRSPRLRFNTDETETGGTTPAAGPTEATPTGTPPETALENGFPTGTPVAEMSSEQQIAYWKFHSRKHEGTARAREQELEQERNKNQSAEEKAADELRRQGEAAGAAKFIGEAVHGQLRALTGKTDDDLNTALEFVDVNRFVKDGRIDRDKLAAFATQLGTAAPAAPTPPTNPLATIAGNLSRTDAPGAPRTGGSINQERARIKATFAERNQ